VIFHRKIRARSNVMWPEMTDRFHVRRRGPANARPSGAHVSDRRLDALLHALPPAPERLVARVLEIPLLEGALAHLRRSRDPAPDDPGPLREALAGVGLEPDEVRVRMLGELRWRRLQQEPGSENSPSEVPDMR
jgi:hypothetical protein